jgi:hypothetical protein
MIQTNQSNGKTYDNVWTERFAFFKENGSPQSKEYQTAYKLLPYIKKLRMNINFYAFLFGFIYFFMKGMWKGAITLIIVSAILLTISSFFPEIVTRITGLMISFLGAHTANYTFYRKEILGEDDFNIFKEMRF